MGEIPTVGGLQIFELCEKRARNNLIRSGAVNFLEVRTFRKPASWGAMRLFRKLRAVRSPGIIHISKVGEVLASSEDKNCKCSGCEFESEETCRMSNSWGTSTCSETMRYAPARHNYRFESWGIYIYFDGSGSGMFLVEFRKFVSYSKCQLFGMIDSWGNFQFFENDSNSARRK